MIRLLVRFSQWLDKRYPAKAVVKVADYQGLTAQVNALQVEMSFLRSDLEIAQKNVDALVSRAGVLESSAVHKGAVQDLVGVVKAVKEDVDSLKVNLGFNRLAQTQELRAVLNGEFLPEEPSQNG